MNRVFKDKPGGLVVDYIGIAAELRDALRIYTDAKGKGQPTVGAEDALMILQEKLDVVRSSKHTHTASRSSNLLNSYRDGIPVNRPSDLVCSLRRVSRSSFQASPIRMGPLRLFVQSFRATAALAIRQESSRSGSILGSAHDLHG